jgi:hypothetical protein
MLLTLSRIPPLLPPLLALGVLALNSNLVPLIALNPNLVPLTTLALALDPSDTNIRSNTKIIVRDSYIFYAKVGTKLQVKKKRNKRGYLSSYKILEEI